MGFNRPEYSIFFKIKKKQGSDSILQPSKFKYLLSGFTHTFVNGIGSINNRGSYYIICGVTAIVNACIEKSLLNLM